VSMKKKRTSVKPDEVHKPTGVRERNFYLAISCILFFALILRVVALLCVKNSIYFDFLLWDERLYHTWAMKIADGTYNSKLVYEFAPLPAYLMAVVYKILSPNILYIRIMNIIFGVLTCYFVYLIGKKIANRTVGIFACIVAAVYKPFIFYSIVPLKTALSAFMFALALYLFVAILDKHSTAKTFLLGIVCGLMLNVRGNYGIIIPVMLLAILLGINRGQRRYIKNLSSTLLIFIAGLALSISPFIIRNYKVAGEFALTGSQAGFNLYLGNNLRNPYPYFRPVPFASPSPSRQGIHFTIEASRRAGNKLSPQEASSYWTREVFKTASEHPAAFIRKLGQKTLALFNRFEAGDHYHIGFISNYIRFFKFPFLNIWLILPLGMAGMAVSIFRSKKFAALSAIFLSYAATLIAFYTNTRYRLPLLIVMIPFAVAGIVYLRSYIKDRRFKMVAVYSIVAVVFFIIEFFPIKGADDMSAYYNTHAIVLDSKGMEDQAIQYWEMSSEMNNSFSVFADIALVGKYFAKGDINKANAYINKIPDHSFAAASKHEMKGDMMMAQSQSQFGKAIPEYRKSLLIHSGQTRVRKKLIRIYRAINNMKMATKEEERLRYISSFYQVL
jgi:4-amino-4-deoxy-L-arabinose transferase-like glycosyltransferase